MDYIEKLDLQTEEIKEVENLEKHKIIISEPFSVNKYKGHDDEFLAVDGDYNDGFNQLNKANGLGINCIISKEVKEAREDVNGNFHTKLKDRIDIEVNEIKTSKVDKDKIGFITPEMFGVVCDGTDETEKIQNCIKYAMDNNVNVEFRNGKEYSFRQLLIYKPCSINFNNAVLKNLSSDENSSFIVIGNKNDSFETMTLYSSKFNISNININLNKLTRKYGVEIHARHININRIVVRECINNAIYCGDYDGVWIEQILCFGNNENTSSNGVVIGCNDIILGNVECAYFRNGVYVENAFNDIEIDKLHVWSDVEGCCAIKYGETSYYGHINSLVMDCLSLGVDLSSVDGYGKMKIDNITVVPSTKFPNWQIINEKFLRQTMGVVIGYIYGISDADETLRLQNFNGIIKALNNYNQRPTMYAEYSNMAGSGHNFEQINGLLYQTSWAKVVITNTNSTDLGFTTGIN